MCLLVLAAGADARVGGLAASCGRFRVHAEGAKHGVADNVGQQNSERQGRKDSSHQQYRRIHPAMSPWATTAALVRCEQTESRDSQAKVILDFSAETSTTNLSRVIT
jgi:hypothetical protein